MCSTITHTPTNTASTAITIDDVARGYLDLLDRHAARYPLMTWQDAYKLVYQGVLGPGHLVSDPEAFKARLLAEILHAAPPPAADEPFYEPIRPDGRLLRVHLRPYRARGGDPDRLLAACLATAAAPWGAPGALRTAWAAVAGAGRAGRWPGLGEMTAFSAWVEAHDYPAVHHSSQYREAYRPAYRLVSDTARAPFDGAA